MVMPLLVWVLPTAGNTGRPWLRVIHAAEVDPDTDVCPGCGGEFTVCQCPGPTMQETHDYKLIDGVLFARPLIG